MPTIHTGAVIIAILSGSYSLVALLVGSPLEFGVALALCGTCWIAADFIETVVREPAPHVHAVPAARLNRGYGTCHVVLVSAGECFTRGAYRPRSGLPGPRLDGVGDGGHSGRLAINGGQDWGCAA